MDILNLHINKTEPLTIPINAHICQYHHYPSVFQIESLKVLSDFSFSLTNYTQLKVV